MVYWFGVAAVNRFPKIIDMHQNRWPSNLPVRDRRLSDFRVGTSACLFIPAGS
jgi:hypothetical protein